MWEAPTEAVVSVEASAAEARGEAAPHPAAEQEENGKEIIINKRYIVSK